uniref:TATA box-binding protein-associated factor RNA polymerase I subunit B n=1 Tax=Caenorhabditis tropicalis TaxID=1561998 RepID=A0A1I7UJW5_9PELO
MPPDENEKCNACGGYKFSINDGFKYCDRCGALLENFEELEAEEGGMQQTVGQGKVKVKQKEGEKKKDRVVPVHIPPSEVMAEALEKRSNFLKNQAVRKEELPVPMMRHRTTYSVWL